MSGQSQGAISKLSIDGTRVEFLEFNDETEIQIVDGGDEAIRGELSHAKERTTQGLHVVGFSILMQPSPVELDLLLPHMGFTESPTDTFTINDSITAFDVVVDKVAAVHTYSDCYINRWTLSGVRGRKPIRMKLDILGTSVAESGSVSGSIDTGIAYGFHEGGLTLEGTGSRPVNQFRVIGDNMLHREWNMSQTAGVICPRDRKLLFVCNAQYGDDEEDLFTNPLGDADGAAATLAFSRGNLSTSLAFANVKSVARPPSVKKEEIRLPLYYEAYKSGSTAPLIITHDATP